MSENKPRRRAQAARAAKKSASRKSGLSRVMLVAMMMVMVAVVSIGGTLAWLQDETQTITNTFTASNIKIELTETPNTDTDGDGTDDAWKAQMIPGKEYAKNPTVTVFGDDTNTDIYLYVKFEETDNPSNYLSYTSNLTAQNSGWALVPNQTNVWYREVKTSDTTKSWNLLDSDKVTVKSDLTKEGMPDAGVTPKLIYTAYAIQTEGFTPESGWAELNKPVQEEPAPENP